MPVTDLFLLVGEGLAEIPVAKIQATCRHSFDALGPQVGITTEGIFADKTKGQGRRSRGLAGGWREVSPHCLPGLKECYKKCRSQTCFQPARCLGNTWNPRHAQDAPFRTRRSGDANASWRLADEFGCGEAPSQHETQRGSFDPIQMTHWHHVGPVGEHVGPPSFPKLFRNKRIHT